MGRTGRGLAELDNVPVRISYSSLFRMLVGLTTCRPGHAHRQTDRFGRQEPELVYGFCAGSRIVVDHWRIDGTSFFFSNSENINILRNTPLILSTLQENVRAIRAVLDRM